VPDRFKSRSSGEGRRNDSVATSCELKKSVVPKLLSSLAEVGSTEENKSGLSSVPGLARIITRRKPATKTSKKMFGKETVVKSKPAKTIVKAFPAAALKSDIWLEA